MCIKIVCFLLFSCSAIAQKQFQPKNLILNPSFESYNATNFEGASGFMSFQEDLAFWKTANKNTPDLKIFNKEAYLKCQRGSKYCSKPRTGKNMVGIMSHMTNHYTDTYREYIVVPLKESLRPNIRTYVEVWVRKDTYARLVCNNLGFFFSKRAPMKDIMTNLGYTPHYNHTAIINQDTQKWERISGSFMPEEAYTFLTMGNFYDNRSTTVQKSKHHSMPSRSPNDFAYYLIDDVRVWQEGDSLEEIPPFSSETTTPTTLENIEFETNSAILLTVSKKELLLLVQFLQEQPQLRIAIHGHTDIVGDKKANLDLSTARAQIVVNFLIKNGITKNRLTAKGFGSETPIASNETAAGRAKNRRVEFVIL
ncbi:MAG: OmpA family protein [Aureispira sp.]